MNILGEIWRAWNVENSGLDPLSQEYYIRTGDGGVDSNGHWWVGGGIYSSPEYNATYSPEWIQANGGCAPAVRDADHEATYTCAGSYVEAQARGKFRRVSEQEQQAQLPVKAKRPCVKEARERERREREDEIRKHEFTQPSKRHENIRRAIQDVPPLGEDEEYTTLIRDIPDEVPVYDGIKVTRRTFWDQIRGR